MSNIQEKTKETLLEIVEGMLNDESAHFVYVNKLTICRGYTPENTNAQSRGKVLVFETGTCEATPIIEKHDFSEEK